jgi:hypothetical protein
MHKHHCHDQGCELRLTIHWAYVKIGSKVDAKVNAR